METKLNSDSPLVLRAKAIMRRLGERDRDGFGSGGHDDHEDQKWALKVLGATRARQVFDAARAGNENVSSEKPTRPIR
jgi:hypothetical protein